MIAAWRHASFARSTRAAARRRSADQIEMRGGWSGGGWPRLPGHKSFRGWPRVLETVNSGWKAAVEMPAKHLVMQAAMKTHLSQPTGAAAFAGQQGISLAISSEEATADISSPMAVIDTSADISAITGRDNGANASPAIIKIESSRRMVIWVFTAPTSHRTPRIDRLWNLTTP